MAGLLEASGVPRTLAIEESGQSKVYREDWLGWCESRFWSPYGITYDHRLRMRRAAGQERITKGSTEVVTNREYRGLSALLEHLPTVPAEDAADRAKLLWQALSAAPNDGFEGTYTWDYYTTHTSKFDSTSVHLLNDTAWMRDGSGGLQPPHRVEFESLRWRPDRFLQSIIKFREPDSLSALAALAEEAGVDLEGLEALKTAQDEGFSGEDIHEAARELRRRRAAASPAPDGDVDVAGGGASGPRGFGGLTPVTGGNGGAVAGPASVGERTGGAGTEAGGTGGASTGAGAGGGRNSGATRYRFVSYVSVRTEFEGEPDPDGLSRENRLALEEAAISRILEEEPALQRTPTNNPGFDLHEVDESGATVRWVEVKAMSRDMRSRPATMSHTQFGLAREEGEAYWLYVVEHAGTDGERIVPIQNPAGRDSTYTFDHGWRAAAEGTEGDG